MESVGVRELKTKASEILRRLRDDGETFEITFRGRVIGRIVPTARPRPDATQVETWRRQWDALATEIGAHWPKGVGAVEAVREQRREL